MSLGPEYRPNADLEYNQTPSCTAEALLALRASPFPFQLLPYLSRRFPRQHHYQLNEAATLKQDLNCPTKDTVALAQITWSRTPKMMQHLQLVRHMGLNDSGLVNNALDSFEENLLAWIPGDPDQPINRRQLQYCSYYAVRAVYTDLAHLHGVGLKYFYQVNSYYQARDAFLNTHGYDANQNDNLKLRELWENQDVIKTRANREQSPTTPPFRPKFDLINRAYHINCGSTITDSSERTPDDPVLQAEIGERNQVIAQVLTKLFHPRQIRVLIYRWGLFGQPRLPYREIGQMIGVKRQCLFQIGESRQNVFQIEANALKRLQHPICQRILNDFRP